MFSMIRPPDLYDLLSSKQGAQLSTWSGLPLIIRWNPLLFRLYIRNHWANWLPLIHATLVSNTTSRGLSTMQWPVCGSNTVCFIYIS